MVVFFYSDIMSGGAETLIMRLGRNLKKFQMNTRVICKNISLQMQEQYIKSGILIEKVDAWSAKDTLYYIKEEDIVFTFFFQDFLMCASYAVESKLQYKLFLYLVNPKILRLERLSNLKIGRNIVRDYFKKIIYNYINNGNIIFMDEMCVEWTEEFYHQKIEKPEEKIFRLPMEDINWSENEFKQRLKQSKENFQILTIARADFPFKAYIKGLIEDFTTLQKKYPYISLKIISYGAGIQELKLWIETASARGAKKIELIGEIEYDKLEDYYQNANLYVGMGTTILDAAKYGIISLNALMYSYELKSTGFFHDYPYLLGAEQKNCEEAKDFLEQAILFSDEEYEVKAKKTRELFVENYAIQAFINRILKHSINVKSHFVTPFIRHSMNIWYKLKGI